MKKYILGAIFSLSILISPAFAHQAKAAGLDSCEANAIIQVIQSFNVDLSVLISVQTGLGTPTIGVDQSGNVCQPMIVSATVSGNAPATVTESSATSITCGADVVDKPNVDATPALLKCFSERSNGVTSINLKPGNYYIKTSIDVSSLSNITLQTEGITSGIACLKPGSPNKCAVLMATDTNTSSNIVTGDGISNFSLKYVGVDGNGEVRRNISPLPPLSGSGTNATIRNCANCHFSGIGIINSVRWGGLTLVFSDNSVVDNSYFANNGVGYLTNSGGPWSDGITVGYSRNFVLENSDFYDNSDVDLIVGGVVGGGPNNTIIRNNHITHSNNYAFAGLMLHVFDTEKVGYDTNFSGTVVSGNTIDCGNGMCGIGLDLGPDLWKKTPSIEGGIVTDNSIAGARQGILIAGADGTNVNHNTVSVSGAYSGLGANNKTCTTGVISNSVGDTAIVQANSAESLPSGLVLDYCRPERIATLSLISGAVNVTMPGIPTNVFANAGNAQVLVSFSPPLVNGGAAVTMYTVKCANQTTTGATSPIMVSGLANNTSYTCTIAATNSKGTGLVATANTVTPVFTQSTIIPLAQTVTAATAVAALTVTSSFSPSTISSTGSTFYSYSSQGSTHCVASHPDGTGTWDNVTPNASFSATYNGSQLPIGVTTTTITCYNSAGQLVVLTATLTVTAVTPVITYCTSWSYGAFGSCQSNNTQTRAVSASSPTGCTGGNPVVTQNCTYVPPVTTCTSWSYGSFGSCQSNNLKIRPVTASYPVGCTGGNPVFTQNCTYIPPVQTVTVVPDYTAFLTATYQTELGRAPDSAGLTYWLDKLTTGAVTQNQVTNFIHNSAEAVQYRAGSASALNAFSSAVNAGPSESSGTGNTSSFHYVWNNNLQIGSSYTEDVKALQTALTREGMYTGEISGGFYNQTFSAVKAFQQKYGIDTGTTGAGFVGSKTRAKLNTLY